MRIIRSAGEGGHTRVGVFVVQNVSAITSRAFSSGSEAKRELSRVSRCTCRVVGILGAQGKPQKRARRAVLVHVPCQQR